MENYLKKAAKKATTKIGMFRHVYAYHTLLGISYLIAMKEPWFSINFSWLVHSFLDKASFSC
jgi:hypothetical protein